MARKQNKKSHTANHSIPVEKVSTSTNTNDSPKAYIESADLPDKHRRTSILITGGDEAVPHNKTVDDAISSMAKQSASFTDDRILRKSLAFEEDKMVENLKNLAKEAENEPSEVVTGNDDGVAVEDESIAPNQFEEAIKKNKLDLSDQKLDVSSRHIQLELSPRTTTDVNKQLSLEHKDTDGNDSSTDVSASPSQNDKNARLDNDPITSVGDKRKSELQEYIPETDVDNKETNDIDPTQEDLASTDKEGKDEAPEVSEVSHEKDDGLPWESESRTNTELPWETEDINSDKKDAEHLPRKEETHDEGSRNDGNLLRESNDPSLSQVDENKLPWESEVHNDGPTSQLDEEEKQSEHTNVHELFGDSNDNEFLNEIQKQEESKDKDEILLGSSEKTSSAQPSSQDENTSQEMKNHSATQAEVSHSEKNDKLATKSEKDSRGNEENLDTHKPQATENLDELFQDDDHDFLQELVSSDHKSGPFKFPLENNAIENKDNEQFETQNKSLDFLELDDDLLDDEFMEDGSTSQAQTIKSTSNKQAYLPSLALSSTTPTVPTKEKPKELNMNKKKNDAYDFPDNLIANKFKPAARSTNKYAPVSSSQNSTPVSKMPSKIPPSTNSVGGVPVSNEKQDKVSEPFSASESTQGQKKSFFEDLPMPIQKQIVKPARAALPKSQTSQNISPIVNTAKPQLQRPVVNPYAKPTMSTVVSPPMNYAQPPGMPPVANNKVVSHTPSGMVAPPPPPTSFVGNNNMLPQTQPQPFPSMQNASLGPSPNSYAPSRKISNPSPNLINTALTKVQGVQSATSPYVPNAGPYAPSSHKRTLSRASSLIGAKSKEVNPYAPVSINVPTAQQAISQGMTMPNTASPTASPAAMNNNIHGRRRGVSNVKSNFYHKEQTAPKVENPNALLQRQFPIFNWSSSKNVAYLIPSAVTNTYNRTPETINVVDINIALKDSHYLATFPGPFNKVKTKKKDVEKWLESYNEFMAQDNTGMKQDELILSHILLSLVKFNGDYKSDDFTKAACAVLNPNVDYNNDNPHLDMNSMSALANAYRLDNSGINIVWSLLQTGNTGKALEFCLSKGDWALALMISSFDGPEKFGKVASEYARSTFPYQKSQSKVHHLMPIMLKLFAGNYKSAIDDIVNVQTEGEWFIQHWRDLVSLVVINKPQYGHEFLCEFSKLLVLSGQTIASQICLILAGLPLSNVPVPANGILFSVIGFGSHSFAYSEIYEYAIHLSSTNIPPTGFAHLLPLKLKHAQVLADYGLFTESQKYCDTISNIIKATGRSSFFNPVAFQEFQNLLMRISQSSSTDLGWFGSKKLNLDKMWDQLDKFIGGDESKAKSGENGLFSKFSPSVSRAPSSLDITSMHNYPQTLPQGRPDQIRDTLIAINSAPGTSSENSILKLNGILHSRPPPSLYSNNSTTSIQKYAPSTSQVASKLTLTRNDQLLSSQQQTGNPVYESLQQSRMVPNNSSSQYLPANQGQSENTKVPSKYPPIPQKVYSNNNGSFPYINSTAQFSNLSIASHQSLHMGISGANTNPSNTLKRPSISNSFSENHINTESILGHKHTSSLQSDISLDYPSEFKSISKSDGNNSALVNTQPSFKRDTEKVPQTITESKESEKSLGTGNSSSSLAPITTEEHHSNVEDLTCSTLPQGPSPKGNFVPNTVSTSAGPKKARARANPYAPGAVASRSSGSNKYGPQSSNKYVSSKQGSSLLVDTASDISYNDIFNYGGYNAPEKPEANDNKPVLDKSGMAETPNKKSVNSREEVSQMNTSLHEPLKAGSIAESKSINVDESFDNENINDQDFETSSLHTPKAKTPFSNNLNNSFRTNEKESMFHPYQDEGDKSRRTSNFGVDSSFGDFPIPGSPDLTTRANSVIGGPGGFFSSRLSQSQQSALYQQYEVDDDTVKDYIPVVDEEEEDSDDELLTKEKRKKEEQNHQARIEADRRQRQDTTASQRTQNWWPGFLGRKNDDKPKPIRAKLGEKNTLVYDEKLKRWIDKSTPLEDQLKSSAPPPPPASKKKQVESSSSSKSLSSSTPGPAKQDIGPAASNSLNGIHLIGPSQPRPSASGPPPPAGPSLANAGLDDLLSLGGGPTSGRKTKKGPRRGYVNLLDQK